MRPSPKTRLCFLALSLALSACPGLAPAQWNPLDTTPGIVPGSALDLSGLNDGPAGQYGAVEDDGTGDLVFANGNGKVRFYGPNIPAFMTHAQTDALVARLSGMGYNVVRILGHDIMESWQQGIFQPPTTDTPTLAFNATSLDQLDYLLAALKKKGIYAQIDLFYLMKVGGMPTLSSYGEPAPYLFPFLDSAYSLWQAAADKYLTHPNIYLNNASIQADPMILGMSPWNETLLPNMSNPSGTFADLLLTQYNTFLASKGLPSAAAFPITPTAVNTNTDSFWKNIPTPAVDYVSQFYMAKTMAVYGKMKTHLKTDLGVPGLVTGLNFLHSPLMNYWRSQGPDAYENHLYYQWDTQTVVPGSGQYLFNPVAPGMLSNALATAAGTSWPSAAVGSYPFVGVNQQYAKPVFLTEFHDVFPNPGRDQAAIVTSTIGAFQGWDVLQRFAFQRATDGASNYKVGAFNEFSVAADPAVLMSEYEGVLAFRAGHLKQAAPRFAIVRDKTACALGSSRWTGTTMGNLAFLPYLFNVVTVYVDAPSTPMALYKIPANTPASSIASGTFPASSRIAISSTSSCLAVAQACVAALDSSDFTEARIKSLQQTGLAAGKLVSETGEITFDYAHGVYLADTPYLFAVAGTLNGATYSFSNAQSSAAGTVASGGLYSASLDGKGTLFASSLDGNPLNASTRILVIATTDAKSQNASVTAQNDGSGSFLYTLPAPSDPPSASIPNLLLSSTGQVSIATALPASAFTAYKIGMTGLRVGTLPVTSSGNRISIAFDTNSTFAFEIVTDPVKAASPSTSSPAPTSTFQLVLDNESANDPAASGSVSSTGTWNTSNFMSGYYLNDYHYSTGASDTFRWTPNLPQTGSYQVYFHYPSGGAQASPRAACTISYAGGSQTVPVNEQAETGWAFLGTFSFSAGSSGYVQLQATDAASGYHVDADAVAFVQPATIVVDNTAATLTPPAAWTASTSLPNYYGSNYVWALSASGSSAGATKIRWTPTISTPGNYLVYCLLPDGNSSRSPTATYTVSSTAGLQTVTVNQQVVPGGRWQLLGTYHFNAGTAGYVELSDAGAGGGTYLIGDAVAFVAKPF